MILTIILIVSLLLADALWPPAAEEPKQFGVLVGLSVKDAIVMGLAIVINFTA